jgi:CelD/BcsL family acetyltransferase involved in cellulose biosynthesis
MKNKHTPAPWAIENTNHGIRLTYSDGMLRSHVADLFTAALCEEHGNLEANARLIAAAPDLLSALSAIVADYHALQRTQGASASLGAEFTAGEWLGSRLGGHIAQAESAIAKAKEEA